MKNLVWLLFLPGFLCNSNPLQINPNSLVTWKGSCVLIPCQIGNYKGAQLSDIALLWYFQPVYDTSQAEYSGHLLYNSSAMSRISRTRLQSASASQLEFVGNLEMKNCSLKISQVRTEDDGIYGTRLFASYSLPVQRAKWFLTATVNVAESPPDPKMDIRPKEIREGGMKVTCSVPYHCPEEPLRLTISGLGGTRLSSQRMTISNGRIQTVVNLQMTWEDHGKSLICSLKRQNWLEISKNTMQLDVKSHSEDASAPATSGLKPTAESAEGPQSSPPLPSTPEGVSTPLPSTSCPPSLSELPPTGVPIPPLSSSQAPCDGRTLWEEFSFLSEPLDQVVKAQNQFIHSFQELTSAVAQLTQKFQEALRHKRQKTCVVPSEIKK